jgi:hypothetical protein
MAKEDICVGLSGQDLNTCKMMNKLANFEFNIEGPAFRYFFVKIGGDDHMANHLWNKFHAKNHSILALFGYSDLENQRMLAKVVNQYPEEGLAGMPWEDIRKFDETHPIILWA